MVSAPLVVRLPDVDSDILGHRADGHAADHRHVVGAGDGDGDVLRDHAAVLVVEGDGVGLVHGLVGGEGASALSLAVKVHVIRPPAPEPVVSLLMTAVSVPSWLL